jgi:hypothetical protein
MFRHFFPRARVTLCACFGFVLAASIAQAGYTPVANPTTSGEKSHEQILEGVYGGNFNLLGVNYDNGNLFAVRIHDFIDGEFGGSGAPIVLGDLSSEEQVTDQIWRAHAISGQARARYANNSQEFGYVEGISGFDYTELITVTGNGFNVSGSIPVLNMSGKTWRWARDGEGEFYTSSPLDNVDDLDHMVTYRLEGGSFSGEQRTTYLLFWEDAPLFEEHDGDYNDLVIEITAYRELIAVHKLPAQG